MVVFTGVDENVAPGFGAASGRRRRDVGHGLAPDGRGETRRNAKAVGTQASSPTAGGGKGAVRTWDGRHGNAGYRQVGAAPRSTPTGEHAET